jgi:hypothetical protein
MGFHGKGRMGTSLGGMHGTAGRQAGKVQNAAPAGFQAMGPAPKFPGTGGVTMPTPLGSQAPVMPGFKR